MRRRIPIKNHHEEIQLTARRSLLAILVIGILIMLLITRLAYLQLYKHDVYTTLATKNRMDLVPTEPTRGLIYDRNGILLAENIPVFSLDVLPYEVPDMKQTLEEIGKIVSLSDNDLSQFQRQLRQHRRFDEIPLKLKLTEEEVGKFAENQHRFPGVVIKARLIRHYPFGETFSHVLGYVGRINAKELNEIDATNYSASHYIGKLGIEKHYENELHGMVGYDEVENDARGKSIRVLKEIKGVPGKNLYLTLDSSLQFVAEEALKGMRGAVVVIEPATGQILAMVSQPGYDPNLFVTGISQSDYKELQESEDQPLYDRALRGMYPPASTLKPFLALKGLETGIITEDTRVYDPGYYEVANGAHRYRDWDRQGHGYVDVNAAILKSCDTFFYSLSDKMGIKNIDKILGDFGFGSPTGVDLNHEAKGVLASPDWKIGAKGTRWYQGDTILTGIGQGYMQSTPLQLAYATSILANRGQKYKPYLLLGSQIPGESYLPQQPVLSGKIELQDPQNWDIIIDAMENTISSSAGTARRFGRKNSYSIAAKTGTAQIIAQRFETYVPQSELPERLRDHHLFIAFAPVEDPKIAIAVIVENVNAATVVASKIVNYYLGKQHHADRQPEKQIKKTGA